MSVQQSDLNDPALVTEVDLARAAAQEEAGDERVGEYVSYHIEDEAAVTHLFEADKPGYRGWRWAVTITSAGPATDITVSEVVLLPGPSALVAPDWIPWQNRVQAGDLGVGDLMPTSPDDPRLVPAYLASDDPYVEEVATDVGLGRVRVMSRPARLDAASRWQESEFGPRSDMARSAPAHCGTCGFYLPLAGSLRAAFGTCGNEISPADGHVVHAEYGCGAHSEAEVEQVSPVLVADLIYDDAQLDVEPLAVVDEVPPPSSATAPTEPAAADVAAAPAATEDVASPAEPTAAAAEPVEPADVEASAAPEPTDAEATATPAAEPPAGATAPEGTAAQIPSEASVGVPPAPVAEGFTSPPVEAVPSAESAAVSPPEPPAVASPGPAAPEEPASSDDPAAASPEAATSSPEPASSGELAVASPETASSGESAVASPEAAGSPAEPDFPEESAVVPSAELGSSGEPALASTEAAASAAETVAASPTEPGSSGEAPAAPSAEPSSPEELTASSAEPPSSDEPVLASSAESGSSGEPAVASSGATASAAEPPAASPAEAQPLGMATPAEIAAARWRRQGAFPVDPVVGDSVPSPLRQRFDQPKGQLPKFSIDVPRILRRKSFGPADDD